MHSMIKKTKYEEIESQARKCTTVTDDEIDYTNMGSVFVVYINRSETSLYPAYAFPTEVIYPI